MKVVCGLLLCPVVATAGAAYDLAYRSVNQSALEISNSTAPSLGAVVTHYVVQNGTVRVGGPTAKTAYIFKDKIMYVIDNTTHAVHVLKHATLNQVLGHYADSVKQLEEAAANSPPDNRADAERKAADMRAVSERMRLPVPRDYKVTVRFESVDGHACRIWEEREADAKRLELCIAAAAAIPGGADILNGMKTLSQFRQGSNFAFGVEFGVSEWWADFALLGGVPILVREFKYDSQISEVMLSTMHAGEQAASLFDIPADYQTIEGPDYTQWFVR